MAKANTNKTKRERMPNLVESEKLAILDLVVEHFHIIENKRTDAVTAQQKAEQWDKIAEAFNAVSNIHHRTAENLKTAWDNMKKTAKRVGSQQKADIFLTGR